MNEQENFNILMGQLYEAIYVLQQMNDSVQQYEPFSKELEDDGFRLIRILAKWKIEDKDLFDYVGHIIDLLSEQIDVSHKLAKKKQEAWDIKKGKLPQEQPSI